MHTLRKKCTCTCACVPMQRCGSFFAMKALLRTYLGSCASIVQAVVCRPPCLLSRQNQSTNAVRSRNPSKSTLAHDVVTDALLHKYHWIIHAGAGLIQFVYGSHSRLAACSLHQKIYFSSLSSFRASFQCVSSPSFPSLSLRLRRSPEIQKFPLSNHHLPIFVSVI